MKLGLITIGCEELTDKIDAYLCEWRGGETYKIATNCPRFSTGEAKGIVKQSVRGYDIYILVDVLNYGITYNMYGTPTHMSPDDHFSDLKRVIAAMGGKAGRITVVMPMLYESRQHKRNSRESLDCALALQELVAMGVDNIITFDAHDPRVQNAIPLSGFENAQPYYQMIKALLNKVPDLQIDHAHSMVISPDEGAMPRSIYYSATLGLDLGMFYKRRDYTIVINGRNPIIEHTYLGGDVNGKDIIIAEDMISSGDSILDVGQQLKNRGARRIFVFATFGFFVDGLEKLDKGHEDGLFEYIFTTNLIYRSPLLDRRAWYVPVDMSKYISLMIDNLHRDISIGPLLNPFDKIKQVLPTQQ